MDRRTLLVAGSAGLTMPFLISKASFAEPASDYKTHTLMVGTLSKKISEIASQKSDNRKIKEFAGYEIAEQTAVAQVLTATMDPPPPELPAKDREMIEMLGKASGKELDQHYIKAEIEGHEKLLKIQEAMLGEGSLKTDDGHIARLAKMVILMHLSMLHDLEKMV